jgi:hypothetical protein
MIRSTSVQNPLPDKGNFKYAPVPKVGSGDNGEAREHIKTENEKIKNMEIKHLDITNRNLLKKVLSDCNYTNEKKALRL